MEETINLSDILKRTIRQSTPNNVIPLGSPIAPQSNNFEGASFYKTEASPYFTWGRDIWGLCVVSGGTSSNPD